MRIWNGASTDRIHLSETNVKSVNGECVRKLNVRNEKLNERNSGSYGVVRTTLDAKKIYGVIKCDAACFQGYIESVNKNVICVRVEKGMIEECVGTIDSQRDSDYNLWWHWQ